MRPRPLSLGAKLNLSLLAFLLLLAAATSAIIVYGFNRTRDNADARSNEALEQGGSLALQAVAGGVAEQGGLLFEAVAEIGQRASIYVESRARDEGRESPPTVEFATSDAGHRYDPNPERVADLVVIRGAPTEDGPVRDDIAFSSALETIFPVLLQGFDGQVGGRNLDPIAIVFLSVNGVTRYYPPVGIQNRLPSDEDFSQRMAGIGPDVNPERRTIWTAPYEDGAGQGLIVTARTPVYDGQSFRGSMEVDVAMSNVFAQINGVRPTPRSFAFYVDRSGTLLEGRSFPLLNTEAGTNPAFAQVLDAMRSLSPGAPTADAKLQLDGEDYYIAYSTVPGLGGTFAVAAPVSDITAAAASISSGIDDEGTRTVQVMLASMAVLFALGMAGAAILNRNAVIKPINLLVAAARAVGAGDLGARVPVAQAGDELTELGVTFNTMVEQLRESERVLEQRVEDRTRELGTLLDVSQSIASTIELAPLFDVILDQLRSLVDYEGAAVVLREGSELRQIAVRRPAFAPAPPAQGLSLPITASAPIWDLLSRGEVAVIDDIRGASELARAYQDLRGGKVDDSDVAWIHAWAAVPLVVREVSIGFLAFSHSQPARFTAEGLMLARAVADQAAVAIANAQLFGQTQRQARDMDALLRADAELFGSLNLDSVLQSLVDVAVDVLGADKSLVLLHEGNIDVVRAARNYDAVTLRSMNEHMATIPHVEPDGDEAKPQVLDDVSVTPEAIARTFAREGIVSHVSLPVHLGSRMLGAFGVGFTQRHAVAGDELRLYAALADRAAVAIQNAELFERAQQAASLEERQRLARELHDSVSQALYGIALGTRTARLRLGDDPQNAAEPIDYVMSLAEAGLAEMRALIFELRPESLELEGVVAAIEKQAASTRARYKLDVVTALGDEPDCALDVKEALYRIAQEALHNVVKHAQAQRVEVRLERDVAALVLTVRDDGRGFDATGQFPGHVGLRSMPERAAKLGGTVVVESTPGSGTRVVARVPL